jgi:hypothetical protein
MSSSAGTQSAPPTQRPTPSVFIQVRSAVDEQNIELESEPARRRPRSSNPGWDYMELFNNLTKICCN